MPPPERVAIQEIGRQVVGARTVVAGRGWRVAPRPERATATLEIANGTNRTLEFRERARPARRRIRTPDWVRSSIQWLATGCSARIIALS